MRWNRRVLLFVVLVLVPPACTAVPIAPMPPVRGACPKTDRPPGLKPLERRAPYYPPAAATRGIQGWACVQFSVTPAGTVANPVILASAPPGVFEEASLEAVRTWRYEVTAERDPASDRPIVNLLQFRLEP